MSGMGLSRGRRVRSPLGWRRAVRGLRKRWMTGGPIGGRGEKGAAAGKGGDRPWKVGSFGAGDPGSNAFDVTRVTSA
ncbi:hypothetical protein GCM10010193_17830 [Kitasatospora atroaurantiaca]